MEKKIEKLIEELSIKYHEARPVIIAKVAHYLLTQEGMALQYHQLMTETLQLCKKLEEEHRVKHEQIRSLYSFD